MPQLPKTLSDKILTIGPDYKEHRGGIGAVLHVYYTFFESFNFIPSYRSYSNNLLKSYFFVKQLFVVARRLLFNKKIEIVHIHGSHGGSFYRKFIIFLIAKKIFRKKIIYHIHSGTYNSYYFSSPGFQKKMIRYFIRNADALICLASFWKFFLVDNFECKTPVIINNVVDKPGDTAWLDTSSPQLNLLFLGKIGQNKGIFDLVEVLKNKKDSFKNKIRLFIGGDGEVQKLKNIIAAAELDSLITYVGWVDKEKKKELFLRTHIYILPSHNEGLPTSILEAMSYGLPVITTPVGGIPEIVENKRNGILIQPGDHNQIESSLLFFLANPDKIKEYGTESLNRIAPYFPDAVSNQLAQLYENV